MHPNKSLREETEFFFKEEYYSVKQIIHTKTKFELDLRNSKMYGPYIKFELNVFNHCKDDERKLKTSIFSKFKRDNSVKNLQTITKFKLDLHIFMTNLHMQFQSYTCIQTKVRERKLKISIFYKFKRDNSVKN